MFLHSVFQGFQLKTQQPLLKVQPAHLNQFIFSGVINATNVHMLQFHIGGREQVVVKHHKGQANDG